MSQKEYKFKVKGMHCPSCQIIVEKTIQKQFLITDFQSNLATTEISFKTDSKQPQPTTEILNALLNTTEYSVLENINQKELNTINWDEILKAFLLAAIFFLVFIMLQSSGVIGNITLVAEENLLFYVFLGFVASISSCMAVVGSLVLSISTGFAKQKDKVVPLIGFHLGRLVSFYFLGGLIGWIGSSIKLTGNSSLIVNLILFIVMVITGLNLLDIFPKLRVLQLSLPKQFALLPQKYSIYKGRVSAILLGVITFILPCGFTQSAQINAIASGSFINGSLIMLSFALGTLPVLAGLSLTSASLAKSRYKSLFFKTSGFIVIIFAIYTLSSALRAAGIIS